MRILRHKTFPKMSAAAKKRATGEPYISEEQTQELVRLFSEGWTQKAIAAKLGVSRPFISKLLWARRTK